MSERRSTRRGRRNAHANLKRSKVTVEPVDEVGEALRSTRFGDVFLGDIGPDGITAFELLAALRKAVPAVRFDTALKGEY